MTSQQRAQKCDHSARSSERVTSICCRRIAWASCIARGSCVLVDRGGAPYIGVRGLSIGVGNVTKAFGGCWSCCKADRDVDVTRGSSGFVANRKPLVAMAAFKRNLQINTDTANKAAARGCIKNLHNNTVDTISNVKVVRFVPAVAAVLRVAERAGWGGWD